MELTFYDINAFLGRPLCETLYDPVPTADDLLAAMDASGIAQAVPWHIAQHDGSPVDGNRLLAEQVSGRERLTGCWTVLPPRTDGVIGPRFFEDMRAARVVALRAFPEMHRYLLDAVVLGSFLGEVAERRVPLLLSLTRGVAWPAVYGLLRDCPNLTCVLCDIGTWSVDRYTYPLLDTYPNVYVETSMLSLEDGGVENMVAAFGADRLLFGTGFPERYAEASMFQLAHAGIPDRDRARIAHGNAERLFTEAQI